MGEGKVLLGWPYRPVEAKNTEICSRNAFQLAPMWRSVRGEDEAEGGQDGPDASPCLAQAYQALPPRLSAARTLYAKPYWAPGGFLGLPRGTSAVPGSPQLPPAWAYYAWPTGVAGST